MSRNIFNPSIPEVTSSDGSRYLYAPKNTGPSGDARISEDNFLKRLVAILPDIGLPSVTTVDGTEELVFTVPVSGKTVDLDTALKRAGVIAVPTVADLLDIPHARAVGNVALVGGYYADGDGGGGPPHRYAHGYPAGTFVHNGGSVKVPTGGDGSRAWLWQEGCQWALPDFGAKGDGVTDDTDALSSAIDALSTVASSIDLVGRSYVINDITKTVSGLTIKNGELIVATAGVKLIGDDNHFEDIILHGSVEPVAPVMNYTTIGLGHTGDRCSVVNCEVYWIGGSGVRIGGMNNHISNVYSHDNVTGLRCNATTRHLVIQGCRFVKNNLVSDSGTDGVLFTRNCTDIKITDSDFSENGEHGFYFQGQRLQVNNSRAYGNVSNGFKFGSYDDGLATVPAGEEPDDMWVDGTGYGLKDIIIQGCEFEANEGDSGVYFQPSSKNILVDSCIFRNNTCRWVYFNYTGESIRLEDHFGITITNNRFYGTDVFDHARISIAAYTDIVIRGNVLEFGDIATYAQNSTITPRLYGFARNVLIEDNVLYDGEIQIGRTDTGWIVRNNKTQNLQIVNNSNAGHVIGNKIYALSDALDIRRIITLEDNEILNAFFTSPTSLSALELVRGNIIDFAPGEFLGSSSSGDRLGPSTMIISDNVFKKTTSGGEALLWVPDGQTGGIISDNVFELSTPDTGSDLTVRVRGDKIVFSGNKTNSGRIVYFLSASSGCIAVNNIGTAASSDAGTGNILSNNLPISAGGTVVQDTSKTTAVSLDRTKGTITTHASNLAAGASASFTWANTYIGADDYVAVQHESGGTTGAYMVMVDPANGSAVIKIKNVTGGDLAESLVLRFVVIKYLGA